MRRPTTCTVGLTGIRRWYSRVAALGRLLRRPALLERRRLAGQHGPDASRGLVRRQGGGSSRRPGEDRPCARLARLLLRVACQRDPERLEVGPQLVELLADDVPAVRHQPSVLPAETSPRQAPDSSPRPSISSLNRPRSPRTRLLSRPAADPACSSGPSAL